ncbi:MAG TPA: anthranilate synthase family protein [Actinospica sp.]|nr:anthranilate synthase family protein [Actinospica sp.]
MRSLLDEILAEEPPPFALIHRDGGLEVLIGEVGEYPSLAELPLSCDAEGHDLLALVPFRQIAERGFECVDDNTPLLALKVTAQAAVPVDEARARIQDVPCELSAEGFDIDDESYAAIVRDVLENEIGRGLGANFVIKRTYEARIAGFGPRVALSLFTRLLAQETGAYWTFLVHTDRGTLIGASPERHVGLDSGVASMNPISGTYRYPAAGPDLDGVLEFLNDPKEIDELYMVVDEELKMMSLVCDGGGRVTGPRLKEMAKLAHTEYFIEGRSGLDPRELLRGTLFAPTVTGSPLESACQVIRKYEPEGRGYYAGAIALFGRDEDGLAALDSAILIRTAQISPAGALRLGVGATLVRHSGPEREVAETAAKVAGLLGVLRGTSANAAPRDAAAAGFARHPRVAAALDNRNDRISEFWLTPTYARRRALPGLEGLRVLVVDAEDTFTGMLGDELAAMGPDITVRRFDECSPNDVFDFDFTVLGPGPGDPRETAHPKIRRLDDTAALLLRERRPFLAVCLSHQVLSRRLGLDLRRLPVPNQGLQREIEFFDGPERVGFYNSFAAHAPADGFRAPGVGPVIVSRDPSTGEVHGLLGPRFASTQFHAESLLTIEGPQILGGLVLRALSGA